MKSKPLSPDLDKIEMLPDAWERTARAVTAAARASQTQAAKPTRKPTKAKAKKRSGA